MPHGLTQLAIQGMKLISLRSLFALASEQILQGKHPKWTLESPTPPDWIAKKFAVLTHKIQGYHVFSIKSQETLPSQAPIIFMLHGGAYVMNMIPVHWQFVRSVLKKLPCQIILVDYPLAPKATFQDTIAIVEQAYEWLLMQGTNQNIHIVGDSAGGGLALTLANQLKDKQMPMPKSLILSSPWVDLSFSHPQARQYQQDDIMLSIDSLMRCARAYAGEAPLTHPWISPIYSNLSKLPPVALFVGTHECFLPDCRLLAEKLKEQQNALNYSEAQGLFHDWAIATFLPEGRQALETMINHIHLHSNNYSNFQ